MEAKMFLHLKSKVEPKQEGFNAVSAKLVAVLEDGTTVTRDLSPDGVKKIQAVGPKHT